jgi:MFS family permease
MNLSRVFRFPPSLSKSLRTNFIYYFWDIGVWAFYTGTTASFLTIYAARCGATNAQIGFLTAAPAVVSLVLALPAGWLLKRYPPKIPTLWSCFGQRVLFIVYALLPWMFPAALQVKAILVLAVISAVPSTVVGISFTQLFIEAVPSEWRGVVVGTRNAIVAILQFVVTLIAGQILSRVAFPIGYQIIFVVGFFGGIMTVWALSHVQPIADSTKPANRPASARMRWTQPTITVPVRVFFRVVGLLFLFNLTNNMVAPLVPNLLVQTLNLSDAMISIGTALSSLLVFVVSLFIGRLIYRTDNRRATTLGAVLLAFNALALALAHDATLYLVSVVIGGIASGILNVAQYNYLLDNVPQEERATWLAWNVLIGNAAVLVGALGGPAIATLTGAPAALIFFGVLRLAVGLAIFRWG